MAHLRMKPVASGSFCISRREPVNLRAFLGTCVGVAIYDETAGIGGLIHLLLPEPPTPGSTFQSEKYAVTGVPRFIKALRDEGATTGNMKATLAGGALIGPVSRQDLNLDIGGRTAELAKSILNREGIEIELSETGGLFASTINLNMETGECRIQPMGEEKSSGKVDFKKPSMADIDHAIERIRPIPQVALKILRMMDDDLCHVSEIAREVRKDQVISARTLKLCNSALFAKKEKIVTLEKALVMLGQKLFLNLIVSAAVAEFYEAVGQGYSLCMGGIYHHAVGTGIIAEKLAEFTGKSPPAQAYTGGLLHDIGKVVLDQYIASGFHLFYRDVHGGSNFLFSEEINIGITHAEVGGNLAEKWSFPAPLVDTVRHHHYPENAKEAPELVHTVYLADLLMSRFQTGLELDRLNVETLSPRMERIGLSIAQLPEIIDMIPSRLFDSSQESATVAGIDAA